MSTGVFIGLILAGYVIIAFLFSLLGNLREIGRRRLFLISLFLTPLIGLAFLLSSQERKINAYTERSYKCERCGYIFAENYPCCPFCEKEGHHEELKPVLKFMT